MRGNYGNLMRVKSIDERPMSKQKRNKNPLTHDQKNELFAIRPQRENSKSKTELRQFSNDYFLKKIKVINKFIDKTADPQIKTLFNSLIKEIQRQLMLKLQLQQFQKDNRKQKIKQYKDNIAIVKDKQEQIIEEAHLKSAKVLQQTTNFNKENKDYLYNYDLIAMEMSPKSTQLPFAHNKGGAFFPKKHHEEERISFQMLRNREDLSDKLFEKIDKIGELLGISGQQRQEMNIKQMFNRCYSEIQMLKKKESELTSLHLREKKEVLDMKEETYKNKQIIQQLKYEIIQINTQRQGLLQQNLNLKMQCNQLEISTEMQIQHLQKENLQHNLLHRSSELKLQQLSHSYQLLQSHSKSLQQLYDHSSQQLLAVKSKEEQMYSELSKLQVQHLKIENNYKKICEEFEILVGEKIKLQKEQSLLAKDYNGLLKKYRRGRQELKLKLMQMVDQEVKVLKTGYRALRSQMQQDLVQLSNWLNMEWQRLIEIIGVKVSSSISSNKMNQVGMMTDQQLKQAKNIGYFQQMVSYKIVGHDSIGVYQHGNGEYKSQTQEQEHQYNKYRVERRNTIELEVQIKIQPLQRNNQSSQTDSQAQTPSLHLLNHQDHLNHTIIQTAQILSLPQTTNNRHLSQPESQIQHIRSYHMKTTAFDQCPSNERPIQEHEGVEYQDMSGKYQMDNEVFAVLMQGEQCIIMPEIFGLRQQILSYKREIVLLRKKLQQMMQNEKRQQQQMFQFHL